MNRSRKRTAHTLTAARLLTAALLLLGLTFSTGLMGCGGSNTQTPTAITIQGPGSDTIDPGDAASFTATVTDDAHNAGVSWTLTGCTAAACGALSSSTTTSVTYTAPATVATAFSVTLTATSIAQNTLTSTVTLSVPVNPSITTAAGALAGATFGAAYSATVAGAGGIPPYTWTITQGALPAGLTLSATGAITGTPTAAGTASFTVTLTDSGSPALTASAQFTLTTLYPPLAITTSTLANGTEGTAYTAMLSATGGSGSGYTWSVISGTALSAVGLSLSSSGAITGIPTTGESAAPVTVQVTDSAGNTATATLALTTTSVAFQGEVLSGQLPVAGATIQLYTVGSTGNDSAATPMLTQTVTTDGLGMFNLTGFYTCGQSSTGQTITGGSNQVYLAASGGSTSSTSTNPALLMVAAVGPCTNLATTPFYTLNELTTAAAAWALAPFSSSPTNIGATATNTLGISNAFLDAALLANPTTGAAATLPTGLTVETGKLSAFADALNSCTSSADGTACDPLFTAATVNGAAPADTFTAALNIVHNPGQNVAEVYATIPTTPAPPFATTLTASPNDWTMSLTVTGGGLFQPTALGIDSQNNLWVANLYGPLSAFNPQGIPLSSTGFGAGNFAQVYGLAIDTSNDIWVSNENGGGGGGSVTEFYGVNNPATLGTSPQIGGYTDSICYPTGLAADTNGDIFIANEECSSATIYSPTASVIAPYVGSQSLGLSAKPFFIAADATHGFWLSDNDSTIAHLSAPTAAYPNGQLLSHPDCCYNSHGLVTDAQGNVWVANYLSNSFSEVGPDGTVLINQQTVASGIATPFAAAIDASQNVWFTDLDGNSILEVAGVNAATPGTELSPSTGVYNHGGFGLDALLSQPYSLAPDRSGNLWVSNDGQDNITMFFGLATPTVTPLQPIPTAP